MEQDQQPKHFYQKFPTWVALSFLTGATAMVAGIALIGSGGGTTLFNTGSPTQQSLSSIQTSADNGVFFDGAAPVTVTIMQPTEAEQIGFSDNVVVSTSAAAVSGVQSMTIWIDGQLIKTCRTGSCGTVIPASALPSGAVHDIQVQAIAASGQMATASRNFSVTVK